ncbi:MAG: ATP-dependent Clp protease proteolytic subunit [Patescibacteria group bacterium]|jgi:ATP-dependent protease ClpP protease subunit
MQEKSSFPTRIIHLYNSFTLKDVEGIIKKIDELNYEQGNISLIIGSNGGSFTGAEKLYDRIRLSPNPVDGLVIGDCFSSATIALLACQKKQATIYSRFLMHNLVMPINLNIGIDTILSDLSKRISEDLSLIKYDNEKMLNIYLEKLKNFDRNSLIEFLRKERIFYFKEAQKIGLINEII